MVLVEFLVLIAISRPAEAATPQPWQSFVQRCASSFSSLLPEARRAAAWRDFYDSEIAASVSDPHYLEIAKNEAEWRVKQSAYTDRYIYRGMELKGELTISDAKALFEAPNPLIAPHRLRELPPSRLTKESRHLRVEFDDQMRDNQELLGRSLCGHSGAAGPDSPFISFARDPANAAVFTTDWNGGYPLTSIRSRVIIKIREPKRGIIDRKGLSQRASQRKISLPIQTPEDEVLHIGTVDPDSVEEILIVNERYEKGGMSGNFHDQYVGLDAVLKVFRDPKNHARLVVERVDPRQLNAKIRAKLGI